MLYDNGNIGIDISSYSDFADIINNTVCFNGNGQVYIRESSIDTILYNNIIWAMEPETYCIKAWSREPIASSNYNNIYAANDAYIVFYDNSPYNSLSEWQLFTGYDENSISTDPLFVDSWGLDGILGTADDDFHLQSTNGSWHSGLWLQDSANSPCIDAGHPLDDTFEEPIPNGQRINLGAYGGTNQASKTPQ